MRLDGLEFRLGDVRISRAPLNVYTGREAMEGKKDGMIKRLTGNRA